MTSFPISLTSKGLRKIPRAEHRNDFKFVVGEICYFCPYYVADFLSERISNLHEVDPTIDSFFVETKDLKKEFGAFVSLGYGEEIEVTESNRNFFCEVCKELQNSEFCEMLINGIDECLTISNAVERFCLLRNGNFSVEETIKFISSHFSEIRRSDFDNLSYEEIEIIVSHPSLKLSTEDNLCEFFISLSERDLSFVALFEHLRFEYLSIPILSKFCDFISDHFEYLNHSIWSSLRRRLLHPISIIRPIDRFGGKCFSPVEGSPLEGIISYLSDKCGGNVHERGIVTITGHDCYSDNLCHAAFNAADLKADSYFYSKNERNQSLTYDFGDRRIQVSHYAIRSRHNGGVNDFNLRSWVIESSIDGDHWIEVDRREDDSSLNGRNLTQLFKVCGESVQSRFVRLRQIGRNHSSTLDHKMVISGFELFGLLIE
jgi:hypothetical protein